MTLNGERDRHGGGRKETTSKKNFSRVKGKPELNGSKGALDTKSGKRKETQREQGGPGLWFKGTLGPLKARLVRAALKVRQSEGGSGCALILSLLSEAGLARRDADGCLIVT